MSRKIKIVAGYLWAVFAVVLIALVFSRSEKAPGFLAELTGMRISPKFTGGEIKKTLARENYKIRVHKPVFPGLLGERNKGFVQIDFEPAEGFHLFGGHGRLRETLEIGGWGEFEIKLPEDEKGLVKIRQVAAGIEYEKKISPYKSGWAFRIPLDKRLKPK